MVGVWEVLGTSVGNLLASISGQVLVEKKCSSLLHYVLHTFTPPDMYEALQIMGHLPNTVDGSEILHQLRVVVYPIIYKGFIYPRYQANHSS